MKLVEKFLSSWNTIKSISKHKNEYKKKTAKREQIVGKFKLFNNKCLVPTKIQWRQSCHHTIFKFHISITQHYEGKITINKQNICTHFTARSTLHNVSILLFTPSVCNIKT